MIEFNFLPTPFRGDVQHLSVGTVQPVGRPSQNLELSLELLRSFGVISARSEVVGAFARLEYVDEYSNVFPEARHLTLVGLAQHALEPCDCFFDGIEAGL